MFSHSLRRLLDQASRSRHGHRPARLRLTLELLEDRNLLSFLPMVNYDVGGRGVAAGDFRGNGTLDLAVAPVSVLLGNGDGTFQPAVNYVVRSNGDPQNVAVGDFRNNGILDLAVVGDDVVQVLLGNGDGTFQAPVSYAVPLNAGAVAVGDFRNNGILDLVVTNTLIGSGGQTVSVLLGNGDGTFQDAHNYDVGSGGAWVAVGDFRNNGILDLAVSNYYSGDISVLLGNGDGTFQAAQSIASGTKHQGVVVGDFNGDGIPDLAVANELSNTVSVLLGNGDGTFQAAHNFAVGSNPYGVAVSDFDGDGTADLVVANRYENTVSILLGNGDGTFQEAQSYPTGTQPWAVAVGDFNGDGAPDLAVSNRNSGVGVLINAADWGGGHPRPPSKPRLTPVQAPGHRQPHVALLLTQLGAHDPFPSMTTLVRGPLAAAAPADLVADSSTDPVARRPPQPTLASAFAWTRAGSVNALDCVFAERMGIGLDDALGNALAPVRID